MTRKSLLDLAENPTRMAAQVHDLIDQVKGHDLEFEVLWNIITALDIAVCDYCHYEWFFIKPTTGMTPRGDVRGLLVAGGACCTKCLDRLYEKTAELEQDELEDVYQDIAHWLLHHRCNVNLTIWGKDPEIKRLMKLYSP